MNRTSLEDSQKILQQIETLAHNIESEEEVDFDYIGKSLERLRHLVMFTHQKIEEFVGGLHIRDLITDQSKFFSEKDAVKIWIKVSAINNEANFSGLLDLADEKRLLPEGFRGIAYEINKLRTYFSHPNAYKNKLQGLREPNIQLEAYQKMVNALDIINVYSAKMRKEKSELISRLVDERTKEIIQRIKEEGIENLETIIKDEVVK